MSKERRQFSGMQRVILLDELGEQFGAIHEYHGLRTPVDAIRLLALNYPEFRKELLESKKNGVGYKVIQSETEFTLDDMLLPLGSKDLIIAPVIAGSGDGFDQILMGAALIGLAYFTLGGSAALGAGGGFGFGAGASGAIVSGTTASAIAIGGNIGIAMALGGISQALAPQQITERVGAVRDSGPESLIRGADGRQSYAYTGAANSVGAGATIPVCFGKALIGSHIISADIEVADESDPLNEWIGVPSPDTIRVQGQKLDSGWNSTSGIQSRTYAPGQLGGAAVLLNQNQSLFSPQHVNITQTGRQFYHYFLCEMTGRTSYKYFMCAFELNNGLYARVGDENSTKVEGYIQFELIIRSQEGSRDVNTIPITVQGLMTGSQEYRWAHWFPVGKLRNGDRYDFIIQIKNYSCDTNINTLRIKQYGYNLLPR